MLSLIMCYQSASMALMSRVITGGSVMRMPGFRTWSAALSTSATKLGAERLNLGGVFPPIPTPFNPDESLAFDKLASNVSKWSKFPFKGQILCN